MALAVGGPSRKVNRTAASLNFWAGPHFHPILSVGQPLRHESRPLRNPIHSFSIVLSQLKIPIFALS